MAYRNFDSRAASNPLRRRLRRLAPSERLEEAIAFLRRHARETGIPDSIRRAREAEVRRDLRRHGFYEHTPDELTYGARIAWRNHARCIGRLRWKSLEVRDLRAVTEPDRIAACLVDHLSAAAAGDHIRSIISIFAPVRGSDLPAYVESEQLISYAGYLDEAGNRTGDPRNIELTRVLRALGWTPPETPGMFDPLPLLLRDRAGRRLCYPLPPSAIRQVPITHPTLPGIGALGLRWYTVPCVSGMILSIGGIDYPCAPFNGHYMTTEIASRDFADERRYDLLPAVATAIGAQDDPLWKDRALLELNGAVLHSFQRAGVEIIDHHTASAQFMDFDQRERAAGRQVSADWAWIVPPQASAACPVFHLPMRDHAMVPNYYRVGSDDGAALAPNYYEDHRGRWRRRWDRWRREIHDWRRARA